jgi:uncharacterized repeat protein (TIGR01451 family)
MSARESRVRRDSRLFAEMCATLMDRGHKVQFRAQGNSMVPNILDGDELVVAPATQTELRTGDVALIQNAEGLRVHRLVAKQSDSPGNVITRSDTAHAPDLPASQLFGKVALQRRHNTEVAFTPMQTRLIHPAQVLLRRARMAVALRLRRAGLFLFGIASLLFFAVTIATPSAFAQADLTMTQTASVTAVATGTNYHYTEIVTNNGPTTIPTGTLVVYQQTPPNTTYQSVTGTNWTCRNGAGTALVANYQGPIVCTYNRTLNSGISAPTITLTEAISAGTAAGTTIQNSATVTSQLTDPTPTNNTTVTSILVEPAASSDLSVSMTVAPTPVFISSNLTYTIVVTNLGQATVPATANILQDVLPAGVTFFSATPPAGWTCSGTTTVQCSLTGTMAMNATATFTITVTAPASATTLSNTAQTTLTGDPNANNNSATVITVVQPLICATPGRDGAGGTISGVVNTYFAPAAGTLAAGATSVVLGAGTGTTTPIAAGDLLLFIQMQDASINSNNTGAYGDGTAGDPATGSSALASSGVFEFVTATNAVVIGGGTLQFTGTGTGGGLLNSYVEGAATGTQGQQTFQVIRVPQYTSATLSNGLVPLAWNGSIGGVLAIDVSAQLTLGGTVTLDALGFRGGGGLLLAGNGTGANTDYVTLSTNPANSSKGEGIAGTPANIAPLTFTTTTHATNTGVEGLPAGSFARGAPGNAGGGGTDGDPTGNTKNSGGGGGGNGGTGGLGGYGWNTFTALNSTDGGFGGAAFPATTSALLMGGGGGAGTTNNGSYYISSTNHDSNTTDAACTNVTCTGIFSSGGAGGGIAIIHAGSVTGTGTISANGQSTQSTDNDSTGGGGAGGSIEVLANSGGLAGLTAAAAGGSAGNAWPESAPGTFSGNRHGPGGGGAGGVVILTGTPAGINVAGGNNGYTDTAQDSYGATPGQAGISSTVHIITETPGTQSGAYCAGADLSVTNSGLPPVVAPGGAITYTQTVTNNGPLDAVNAVFSEAIPANTTFASITTPAGWICTTPAVGATGNISCTNPSVLNLATSTFTVVVNVAAGTINGTQIVDVDNITSGTSDPNLANNSATALTTVSLATGADLFTTMTSSSPTTLAGTTVTMTAVVKNQGPGAAGASNFSEPLDFNTTFASMVIPPGWTCSLPAVGTNGTIYCSATSIAVGASSTFAAVLNVPGTVASGITIMETGTASSATPDPNPSNNAASASTVVATAGQADLAVTSTAAPTLISPGNNITYTQIVTNNGPATVTNGTVTAVTFSDTIPANTTLAQAFVQPTGWNCVSPAVGATGTISCTLNAGQTILKGGTVSFPLVVKVNAGPLPAPPPAGTIISNTANINNAPCSATQDPNCANNFSTTTVIVALPSQADVSIIKTASPEPVNQGTNLTYTLKVTNAGPAIAQGVAVSDTLPAQVTYGSASSSQGTCTGTTTVSCTIGTLSVGSVAIVTINVTANTFSSATLSSNTASVTATTSDPNSGNNMSTFVSTIQSPTAVDLASFRVYSQNDGTALLEWRTHEESRNLGFHLYREDATGRHRVDPSIVAGSALLLRGSKPQHAAKLYRWIDSQPTPNATYWIEDLDINGTRTMHGPYYAEPSGSESSVTTSTRNASVVPIQRAQVLSQLQASASVSAAVMPARNTMRPVGPRPVLPIYPVNYPRFTVADHAAVKISVEQEGWYHVTFAQLYAAGLDSNIDTRSLHLYAEGVEQPMLITRPSGPVSPTDAIEFYGTGIDTPYSGTRVYWLVRENTFPKRINTIPAPMSGSAAPTSFPFSSVREDRTAYFAALLNGENNDNFFGAVVTSDPVGQDLLVTHIDPSSAIPTTLDITLQGATDQQEHTVNVQLNGAMLGQMTFQNQILYSQSFPVDVSLLQSGTNTIALTSMNGDNDVSMVESIVLQYPHTYATDNNWLKATAPAGTQLTITGFSNPQIRVFDITDTLNITELTGTVSPVSGVYEVVVKLPHGAASPRTILAFSSDTESAPVALTPYTPTFLDDHRSNADYVVVAYPDFVPSLTPLLQLREAQGHRVSVVTTDQIYDEYNFGERSLFAIRSYLQDAATKGQRKPQSILFVGDASIDPRNYLGFGQTDFVPTRMIETAAFKTASDDWFTDFQQTGYATIPTGRLPVSSVAEADLMVSKIVNYEKGTFAGTWNSQALVVADQNVDIDFTTAASTAASDLPASLQVNKILANNLDFATARTRLLTALNNGALLVDYSGHGAEQQWSFSNLFNTDDAAALTNGGRLPVYLVMDCLNGFFQDVYGESLAESLVLAPNGGAVAVWASSGFTNQPPQNSMNLSVLSQLALHPNEPLGQMLLSAKNGTTDNDVRRTWILFGDPAMKLQFAPSGNSGTKQTGIPPIGVNVPKDFSRDCNVSSECLRERQNNE